MAMESFPLLRNVHSRPIRLDIHSLRVQWGSYLGACCRRVDMETQYWSQRPSQENRSAMSANRPFPKVDEASALARAIVETVRAPRVLLSVEDINERRAGERRTEELLQQKEILLQETQQRIANNLQVIAGILLLKAHAVQSEAARLYLKDSHQRLGIMEQGEQIETAPYLSRFSETQAIATVGGSRPITIEGQADSARISLRKSVSIRRLAAGLVVNALKRAFVSDRAAARTVVAQKMEEPRWRLIVSDAGAGMSKGVSGKASLGRRVGRERNGSC